MFRADTCLCTTGTMSFHECIFAALQTQLSASTSQAPPRLTSGTAKVPQFQSKDSKPGQIPLLAPPPTSLSAQLPSQLSGVPGKSSCQSSSAVGCSGPQWHIPDPSQGPASAVTKYIVGLSGVDNSMLSSQSPSTVLVETHLQGFDLLF